jgi:winged helix-turn-helix protein
LGVLAPPTQVGRLLQALRWRPQQPRRRARPRDEAAMARWREPTWPALNRGRRSRDNVSSSSRSPVVIPCRAWGGPLRRWGSPPSCARGGPGISSPPSAPGRQRARCPATAKITPSSRMTWSRVWSTCGARSPAPWSSSGMAPPSTAATPAKRAWRMAPPSACSWSGSQRMPQSCILARGSGHRSQGSHDAMSVASISPTCAVNSVMP